jgi:hypothetical protein
VRNGWILHGNRFGALRSHPKEFPNIKCFNIDLPDSGHREFARCMLATILSEYAEPSQSRVAAYREDIDGSEDTISQITEARPGEHTERAN